MLAQEIFDRLFQADAIFAMALREYQSLLASGTFDPHVQACRRLLKGRRLAATRRTRRRSEATPTRAPCPPAHPPPTDVRGVDARDGVRC